MSAQKRKRAVGLNIMCTPEEREMIRRVADECDLSMRQLIIRAVAAYSLAKGIG